LVGHSLFAVLVAIIGVGLVITLYDGGILPIAGPFVVLALAPLLLPVHMHGLQRRAHRLAAGTVEQLKSVAQMLQHERSLPSAAPSTGASEQSLAEAAAQVDSALREFAEGNAFAGATLATNLAYVVKGSWSQSAPTSARISLAGNTAQRLSKVLRRAQKAAG
jgi:hypothetical protein